MSATQQPQLGQVDSKPTEQQLLFARAVILTFELWPAMRLAVAEEWGGPDSKDKRDYIISYICDEFSDIQNLKYPDLDDLAEVLEDYVIEEFECRLDDGSSDWVAGRLVGIHKVIFADGVVLDQDAGSSQEGPEAAVAPAQSLVKGKQVVEELEQAFAKLKGKKTQVSKGRGEGGVDDEDEDEAAVEQDEGEQEASARRMARSQGGVMDVDVTGAEVGLEQR
ncbi:hypothetical protein IE53DRAFT_390965, partial [Violaceomyces palustris]